MKTNRHIARILARAGIGGVFSLTAVAGIVLFALVSSLGISYVGIRDARQNLITQGGLLTQRFAGQSALALLYGSPENARAATDSLLAFPEVEAVGVYDATGVTLFETRPLGKGPVQDAGPSPSPGALIESQTDSTWTFVAPVYAGDVEPVGDGASPFDAAVAPELLGWVRVVQSKKSLGAIARSVVWSNLALSSAIALVLGLSTFVVARRITDPIRALADAMQRAQAGDAGVRAAETGPLELRTMEGAFNRMMDVLEQRETDLRAARDDAMEAARAKAQFAAHVSHELRTPLNGLLGMLQLLDRGGAAGQREEYLRTALSSGHSLLAIINDILDFSRGEAGKIEIEARTFALHARLAELVELLRPLAAAKGIGLDLTVDPDVPDGVVGDPTRLGQVLTNLLGNAIKFTARGGITLRVSRDSGPSENVHIADLRFEVKDTGIGIPPDVQTEIFESFTQASASTGREFGGSGLGLTIARQLVVLMGGQIGVTSVPGSGSTFWVTLALPVAAHPAPALPLSGLRVLVAAGAQAHDLHELTARIERLGARVDQHTSGGQVLLALARAQPDARYGTVLIGQHLAEMHSAELAHYLARMPGRQRYRVLLLTGGAIPETDLPEGVDGLLTVDADHAALTGALAAPDPGGQVDRPVRGRVLVAEDDTASQMVARGLLEAAGCVVDCVGDGKAALDALAATHYDLVLMDVNMPVLDGLAAMQALRARSPGAHPPVIAMTANTLPEDVSRTRDAGMEDFIAKPVQQEAMNAILNRWLRQRPAEDAPAPAAPQATAEADVDYAVLATLRETLGARVDAIIEAFLGDAAGLVAELRTGARLDDPQQVRELAHRLKGAARNVGARELGEVAARVEALARPGQGPLSETLLDALDRALTVTQTALKTAAPVPARTVAVNAPRVLVVEDDRSTRMTLRALLEDDGFAVVEAGDGREALALFDRRRPDLVLMDALLPVQDGFSACREISQRPGNARVPVLMITSLDDEVSVERAFRAGAADFIPKPINLSVLRRRVQRLVSAHANARDAERLAYHDTLTGLINRGAFRERVLRDIATAAPERPYGVVYLDVDRFKRVNDTLGHEVGDEVLTEVAARLRGCLPDDATLARVGSDEFAAAFATRSADDAGQVARRVVAALGNTMSVRGHEVRVSASVGVALCPNDADDVDALIKFAETAATRAKEDGGNAAHFYQARMSTQIRERLDLESDLRKAIDRNQLVVFYQPQVDVAGGRVRGVEALVRWRHPERGLVPPVEFIPLAEETGLIGALGEWVLREACIQARRWRTAGMAPLRMGVNVSARQLAAPEFADVVAHALRESALDPAALELEVTENILVHDREGARTLLGRLRALGVRIAIDDFGTGYSSLGYLKHLPVDTLKIDRTFVSGLPMDAHDVAITTGVLTLARSLGIEVVAEGVETGAQLRFLREHQCNLAQGYLFHAPMPASAFESWIASRAADRRRGA